MLEFLDYLNQIMLNNMYLAPFVAFIAGVISSLMPCSLSSLPLVLTYVGASSDSKTKSIKLSLVFALANALTYMTLALIAVKLGTLIGANAYMFNFVIIALLLMMSLQMFGLYEFIPSNYLISKNTKKGYLGAFITGSLSGLFSSACSTPVLIVILALLSTVDNVLFGVITLLFYSLGHSVLVLIVGSGSSIFRKYISTDKTKKTMNFVNYLLATLIMLFAFYLAYLNF